MSNAVNDALLDLALDHIEYWEGTPMADMIRGDIERQDLETLAQHIKLSASEIFYQEYNPFEVGEGAIDENDIR